MTSKLSENQQKTLMDLQRRSMEIQNQKAQLKAQHASLSMDHSSAEQTLRYLQDQKEEAVVFYAVGRIFVKHSMKEAREGHTDGVKQLAGEISNLEKAINTLDKQGTEAQANLVDFLKTNNIPFQMR